MKDSYERDLAVADALGQMADARIAELKNVIAALLEIIDAEVTTNHDKWLYEKEIAAARLAVGQPDSVHVEEDQESENNIASSSVLPKRIFLDKEAIRLAEGRQPDAYYFGSYRTFEQNTAPDSLLKFPFANEVEFIPADEDFANLLKERDVLIGRCNLEWAHKREAEQECERLRAQLVASQASATTPPQPSPEQGIRSQRYENNEYQRGYDTAQTDALNVIKARADAWRTKDASATSQMNTGFIKTRIAEDFECSEAVLRIGFSAPESPAPQPQESAAEISVTLAELTSDDINRFPLTPYEVYQEEARQKLEAALHPFAEMDREGCHLDEVACSRGTAEGGNNPERNQDTPAALPDSEPPSDSLLKLLAASICPDCDFAYSVTRHMPDNNCENCVAVRNALLSPPSENADQRDQHSVDEDKGILET